MRAIGRVSPLAGVAGVALLGASPAWAQDGPATAAASQDNGDILVLGAKLEESTPEELEKYGSRLEVVEGEAIDKAGLVDTAQALEQMVPGLYVSPNSGAFDYVNVSLLGSRSSEILFLVDGVRISNRLYSSTTPLDTLPASMIERIEVLKGGQGLYYGTQAVSGIVNVITRGFTRETNGAVELGYDTNNTVRGNGYVRGSAGDHYFVAFASHDQSDGFQPFRDEDYQPSETDRSRNYRVTTGGLKYAFEPSDAFRLSASYQHTEAKLDRAYAEDHAAAFNTRNEEIASVKLDWTPNDRFGLYVKGYWHDWDATWTETLNNLGPDGQPDGTLDVLNDHDPWTFTDRGVNVLGEYQVNDTIALVAGYDYQKYNGQDAVFLIGEHAEEVHAPFAQVKLETGGLSLAAGVRHNMPSDSQEATVWNVSGRYNIDDAWYARGQVGTSFRLPDAYELYVIDPCCERGNPDLLPEESFNAELGFGLERGMISGEITGFYREVENLIDITFDLPAFPDGFIINTPDMVKVWGGEAVVNARLTDVLSLTADYTHTEAEIDGGNTQIAEIPRDYFKLILNAAATSGRYGGSAALNWVGQVYSSVAGGIGRVQHGNYAVVDLAAWIFADKAQHHRLGVRLQNALDAEYATRIVRVRRDADDSSYAAWNLGTPLTLHATYSFSF
jgi:vitamin B12 transporter